MSGDKEIAPLVLLSFRQFQQKRLHHGQDSGASLIDYPRAGTSLYGYTQYSKPSLPCQVRLSGLRGQNLSGR